MLGLSCVAVTSTCIESKFSALICAGGKNVGFPFRRFSKFSSKIVSWIRRNKSWPSNAFTETRLLIPVRKEQKGTLGNV